MRQYRSVLPANHAAAGLVNINCIPYPVTPCTHKRVGVHSSLLQPQAVLCNPCAAGRRREAAMYRHARRLFCAYFAILVVSPLAAGAQTGVVMTGQTVPGTASLHPSDELPQDTTFLALIKARDDALGLLGELKRITAYHDKLRNGLGFLLTSLPPSPREASLKRIDAEIERVKKFEDDIAGSHDSKFQIELARKFDRDFPLSLSDRPIPRTLSRTNDPRINQIVNDPTTFARRERANANEVFQNVSFENREFLSGYEQLFSMIESIDSYKRTPLDELPSGFDDLAGAESIDALTETQIRSAIGKYRETLQQTRNQTAGSADETVDAVRARLLAKLDGFGDNLLKKSSELSTQMGGLEKNMTLAARSLYGKTVGADSFNYLLIVFATVFVIIMVVPRFYPNPVAENVLKSEFLLQFSTVFVLVAAIIILAIGGFIEKNQLPVLLAGISGYVLGQLGANTGGQLGRLYRGRRLPAQAR
jgi:hypothetical protein